jgi:hypothetical protein
MIASILIALHILNPEEDEVAPPSSIVNTRRDAGVAQSTGGRS